MTRKQEIHIDGTISYWSVSTQSWKACVAPESVSETDLAAMSSADREQITNLKWCVEPTVGSVGER